MKCSLQETGCWRRKCPESWALTQILWPELLQEKELDKDNLGSQHTWDPALSYTVETAKDSDHCPENIFLSPKSLVGCAGSSFSHTACGQRPPEARCVLQHAYRLEALLSCWLLNRVKVPRPAAVDLLTVVLVLVTFLSLPKPPLHYVCSFLSISL